MNPAPLSVRDCIERNAENYGDAPYLIDPESGEAVSFAQCQQRAQHIAAYLDSGGVQAGEPVAYAFANSVEGALTILGILYGGFLATAINLVAGESIMAYVLEHSESRLIIADAEAEAMLAPILASAKNPPSLIKQAEITRANSNTSVSASTTTTTKPRPEMDGLLMYTSGTTGKPKGAVLTQANILAGGTNTATAHQLTPKDRGLCVLPFYHINAFCVSLMGSLVSGSSLVVPPKFSVSNFWQIIRAQSCSWFSVVPTQISYLLHDEADGAGCAHLRFGRSSSAPLSPDIHTAFEKRFGVPLIETMGLTETAAQILANPLPPQLSKIGSPGIGFGNEVIIGNESQKEQPRGCEGEILVRGNNVLRHYLKNPEATRDTITKDGWLRTGDLGRMDADGYVFVTGRLKELIIKGGENIAPREVDEALYTHPDVVEAAAFAVNCTNYGQRVEAAVRLTQDSKINMDALLTICHKKLGDFKSPDKIHQLPELPKGPSGKIQRMKLAEMLTEKTQNWKES